MNERDELNDHWFPNPKRQDPWEWYLACILAVGLGATIGFYGARMVMMILG